MRVLHQKNAMRLQETVTMDMADRVVCLNGLHHHPSPQQALNNMP